MFGLRAYSTPILRPMWPFLAAGGIVFYGVNVLQDKLVSTPEAKQDPKNPYALKGGAAH
ncbi:putative ATP18-subunit I/j of the mitochondrial F1F0-ATP synthase [Acaromyces ingoldii]|uniref:Putative ATP18-subunit I/j of the mitochondrial F1F0-ATP synthase n=1 Tax=Acaromyces ingoldii TaxID=215250 RepID=A0A316YYS7_9BASI|nr:putative ATP18-subunit I/j of the mitochondrial F1F0-ATP synthase [Acaromyces ingoldii]PWN93934.1 putative ATP18-subunit I/j of the mitochondrial F1F0-ATP synthase [Acaromyces ingoldii]